LELLFVWIVQESIEVLVKNSNETHNKKIGPHISKVRSFKLDNLTLPILELFSNLPTNDVNKIWEFKQGEVLSVKPGPEAEQEKREIFIKKKYVEKLFVNSIETGEFYELSESLMYNRGSYKHDV